MMAQKKNNIDSFNDCTSHCSSFKAEANLKGNNIFLVLNVKLMRSHVISPFMYACESWLLHCTVNHGP